MFLSWLELKKGTFFVFVFVFALNVVAIFASKNQKMFFVHIIKQFYLPPNIFF